jgi:Uncharacterized protein involved in propionate catabolism
MRSARAGIALHATVTDYHTSGAWNALAVAAIGARLLKLGPDKLREALGIAEYHGPRSQMMRVIDSPTMLHDGSAWGALAGVTAVYLADQGFTGAPAATVEAEEVDAIWRDLGEQMGRPPPLHQALSGLPLDPCPDRFRPQAAPRPWPDRRRYRRRRADQLP